MATRVKLPIKKDIEIDQGDSWRPWVIRFPDFTPFGGPHDLTDCTVKAQIRPDFRSEVVAEIEIEYIDRVARRIRPYLLPTDTVADDIEGVWDLQVSKNDGTWRRTFYRGNVILNRQTTR